MLQFEKCEDPWQTDSPAYQCLYKPRGREGAKMGYLIFDGIWYFMADDYDVMFDMDELIEISNKLKELNERAYNPS